VDSGDESNPDSVKLLETVPVTLKFDDIVVIVPAIVVLEVMYVFVVVTLRLAPLNEEFTVLEADDEFTVK